MFFAIICHDKNGNEGLRAQVRPEHLEYLASNEGHTKVVGPLLSDDGETSCGSLLIVEAEDLATARRFAENDPYARAGLFENVRVMPWRPVVGAWLPARGL